jgi:ABC-type multidrug transport system ATPase subunit
MQVRLAFSIAIRAKPDILVLDEVLAVGDESFQRKCLDIFEQYKAQKQTVVLVSHDMETVRNFCDVAIVIDNGEKVFYGSAAEAASRYSALNLSQISSTISSGDSKAKIKLQILNTKGEAAKSFQSGDMLKVKMSWPKEMGAKYAGISIVKQSGEYIFGANTLKEKLELEDRVEYEVELNLNEGKYYLSASLSGETARDVLEILEHGPEFLITKSPDDTAGGAVRLPHSWKAKN